MKAQPTIYVAAFDPDGVTVASWHPIIGPFDDGGSLDIAVPDGASIVRVAVCRSPKGRGEVKDIPLSYPVAAPGETVTVRLRRNTQ